MLKKQNLIEYFYQGIKSKNNLKIGVEHEKFVLNKKNLSHLSYNEPNGIKDILLRFVNDGWKPIQSWPLEGHLKQVCKIP